MLFRNIEPDGIVVLTLHKPKRRNALDRATVDALEEAAHSVMEQPPLGVVITGSGFAFSAGADLQDVLALVTREEALAYSRRLQDVFDLWESVPCPTVAAIEGHCLGGGLELALALDLRVVAETARLGMPEVQLGLCPAAGGTQRLRETVGSGWARALVLSGSPVDAAAAVQIGLGTSLTPPTTALASALGRVRELADSREAVLSFRATQKAGRSKAFAAGLEAEREQFATLIMSEKVRSRIQQFLGRRALAGGAADQVGREGIR